MPGYETIKYLAQRPASIELVARPADGRSRGLIRFRVFRMPPAASQEERQRTIKKAYNTRDAVASIGEHPNIHKVWVHVNEEGDILEGSDWSEAGSLKDLLAARNQPLPTDEALEICRGIALALSEAHAAGIIHRAVKPEHILMMNGIPKLTDFDLSFNLERSARDVTVIPDPHRLPDDGYAPPELLNGEDIDESTDIFSLGVIAFELLIGEKPFAKVRRLEAQGGRLSEQQMHRLKALGLPNTVVDAIRNAIVAARAQRLRDAAVLTEAFRIAEEPISNATTAAPNARLEPGSCYDVYEIIELVGEGAEAQIYRARTVRQEEVALKLFNREIARERIFNELEVAASVRSSYVVHVDGRIGHWNNDRYFIVMEYVDGNTLRQRIERGERPSPEAFRQVALGLLEALDSIHARRNENGDLEPLVHGDVKPDNVLLTRDGKAKLGDFSVAGVPRIDEFQGTVGYVPPDRILGVEMEFSQDGDLFALGVTLWEYLYGQKPYVSPAIGETPLLPEAASSLLPEGLRRWLLRAIATEARERFATIDAMQKAFLGAEGSEEETSTSPSTGATAAITQTASALPLMPSATHVQVLKALKGINPFVNYLNTLSNASAGNENATAEAQASSVFFERIRVVNPLAEFVFEKITTEKRNVILTGNAGDGKTTIAAEVYRALTDHPMPAQPRVEVPGSSVVIVKDMSELTSSERLQVLQEAMNARDRAYLIVSNTGTLLESAPLLTVEGIEPYEVQSRLIEALEANDAMPVLGGRFLLLNVGRTDSINTACAVFGKMLNAEEWSDCENCDLHAQCPILANIRIIRESQDLVIHRLELLYRRLYEYDVRLTMRQMIGHVAYALTAGRDCADIHIMSQTALRYSLTGSLFSNRLFGDDGTQWLPEAFQLQAVRQLRETEFGVALDSEFERHAWTRGEMHVPLQGEPLAMSRRLVEEDPALGPATRAQIRRLVYFLGTLEGEAADRYVSVFLRSPMLLKFLQIVGSGHSIPPLWESEWRRRVTQVLQEYFAGVRLPEGSWQATDRLFITLNRRSSSTATQVVLTSIGTGEFEIVVTPGHRAVEGSIRRLRLRCRDGRAEMALDLPFLDYVARRYEGEVATRLSAFYADRLERFKADLLTARPGEADERCLQLLRIGADRRFRPVRILFSDDHLEVLR